MTYEELLVSYAHTHRHTDTHTEGADLRSKCQQYEMEKEELTNLDILVPQASQIFQCHKLINEDCSRLQTCEMSARYPSTTSKSDISVPQANQCS
jgi:hypothetical protein